MLITEEVIVVRYCAFVGGSYMVWLPPLVNGTTIQIDPITEIYHSFPEFV